MTDKKIALVTGATRGIGYETALALANKDYHIIATGRRIRKLEKLDDAIKNIGGDATLLPLDLTDIDKISQLGRSIQERFNQIDLVVGCAGILKGLTPITDTKQTDWYETMAVNYAANFYILQSIHPLLQKAETPKGIFLTANQKYLSEAYWGAYGMSKAALNSLISIYNAENEKFNFQTFDPGPTDTELLQGAFPGVAKKAQSTAEAAQKIIKKFQI